MFGKRKPAQREVPCASISTVECTIGTLRVLTLTFLLALLFSCATVEESLQTVPERSGYARTSTSAEVEAFIDATVTRSPRLRRVELGRTTEGRSISGVLRSDPPMDSLDEVAKSTKPRIVVMANIHAGEVEGKEAVLELLRDETSHQGLAAANDCVVLFIPNYNADANDKIKRSNRPDQAGPIEGVGSRRNAKNLDLNRDYVRVLAEETRALIRAVNQMDADVVMDLHTTNGSYHGYDLTYAGPLNPATSPFILSLVRGSILPGLRSAMSKRGYATFDYGNWRDGSNPSAGWETFEPNPRFGNSYFGLCNRITILSEAYSHDPFNKRIASTKAFVEETLRWFGAHSDELRATRTTAQRFSAGLAGQPLPTRSDFARTHELEPVLVGSVRKEADAVTGLIREWDTNTSVAVPMPVWAWFDGREERDVPVAWAIPSPSEELLRLLSIHGVASDRTTEAIDTEGEIAEIKSTRRDSFPGSDPKSQTIHTVVWHKTNVTLPKDTLIIRSTQPFARLAFMMLQPESADCLATYDVLGSTPAGLLDTKYGKTFGVWRLHDRRFMR